MTKKSKLVLAMASMLGITAGATAVSGFAWFTTTKSATVDVTNIGVYSKSSGLDIAFKTGDEVSCANAGAGTYDINVVGAAATNAKIETTTVTGSATAEFTLEKYPSDQPTVTIDGEPYTGTVTWDKTSKTVTLGDTQAVGKVVVMSYHPYAALTDVSSVNGQQIYKPAWTASGEGHYATAINSVSTLGNEEGFLRFSVTLTASGASPLAIYLNQPSIAGATADAKDAAAAAVTRVALIEDADNNPSTANVTKLVLQNTSIAAPNNKGIDSDWATTPNEDLDGNSTDESWDLTDGLPALTTLALPNETNKETYAAAWGSTVGNQTLVNNYITTIAAGATTTITVVVWLEGTMNIDANGKYTATGIENGMIKVNLPFIAF